MPKISISAGWYYAVCLFLIVALAGTAVDLLTKHWAFQTLGMPGEYKAETEPQLRAVYWVWQDIAGFQTSLNPGALFGFGAGQTTVLVTLSLVFLVGIILYVVLWAWRSAFLMITLGMIAAGICGNLYDRVGWHGLVYPEWYPPEIAGQQAYAVRDWILCMIGTFHWPNFNFADSLLVCSVILLLLHGLLFEEKETASKEQRKTAVSSLPLTLEAPAKINLFFEVLGKRSDNFHEIVSVAVPIRLFDTLTFEATDEPTIQFDCLDGQGIPLDETNLVVRAAMLIQQRFNVRHGAKITLTKRIPCQAGLGGGSSDAVAALRLACRGWNLDISDAELLSIAAEIGSDCPIFLYDVPTLSKGRGEQIQPLPAIPPLWFVLLKPPEGLSTAQVYAECMPTHDGQFRQPDALIAALFEGNVREIGQNLFNRLEMPAKKLWNRFEEVKNQLLSAGCLTVQMSGSGTAFFGLCEDETQAREIFQRLRNELAPENELFVVQTL